MKKIKLLSILLILSSVAFAQTPFNLTGATATQNFNAGSLDNGSGNMLNTFPSGWGLAEAGSGSSANGFYRAGTGSSGAGDARSFGAANTQERAFGSVGSGSVRPAIGFAFTNNTSNTITQMNVSYVGEQWRTGDSLPLVDTLVFEYSLNASSIDDSAATWVGVSALNFYSPTPVHQGSLDGNLASNQTNLSSMIPAQVPNASTVYFRWRDGDISGTEDGLAVDDFSITVTTSGGPLPPVLLSTTPADNATNVPVSTTALTVTIDNNITMLNNGGVATLVNISNATSSSIPVSSMTFNGATATLSGVSLASNTDYAVLIDANILQTANGPFAGIADSSVWNFTTENTTAPPAVTSLNETFTGCNDPNFGVFTAYSEVGGQNWRCTTFGNGDTNAVRMNGGTGPTTTFDNEDWLISPPLDLSAMSMPLLEFYSKIRFSGTNSKELLVSGDYSGTGSPAAANWTAIQIPNWSALDTVWRKFSPIDLTSYKSSNFHLAFKYVSASTGTADEWTIDDVKITEGATAVTSWTKEELEVTVLGDAHASLNLLFASSKERNMKYQVVELGGRAVAKGNIQVLGGTANQVIALPSLAAGMYFLEVHNAEGKALVKFMVK